MNSDEFLVQIQHINLISDVMLFWRLGGHLYSVGYKYEIIAIVNIHKAQLCEMIQIL